MQIQALYIGTKVIREFDTEKMSTSRYIYSQRPFPKVFEDINSNQYVSKLQAVEVMYILMFRCLENSDLAPQLWLRIFRWLLSRVVD